MQIGRARNIVLQEKQEWPRYFAEENDRQSLIMYGIVMIVVTNLLQALGSMIFFAGFAFMGVWASYFLVMHAVQIVLQIAALFIIPKILSAIAPSFSGKANDLSGLKLYVYAMTPAWIGMLFTVIPILGWLIGLAGGLYGLYLFWQHTAEAMTVPEDKKVGFVLVSALAIIVVYGIISWISTLLVAGMAVGSILGTGYHNPWGM